MTRRIPRPGLEEPPCGELACSICYIDAPDGEAPAEAPAEARDLTVWRSANGRVTKLVDMTSNHLNNTIRSLDRVGGKNAYMLPSLRAERARRNAPKPTVPIEAAMPAKGIPIDDILPTIRENLVQYEKQVQRG